MKKIFIVTIFIFFPLLLLLSSFNMYASAEEEAYESATVDNVCSYDENAKFDNKEIEEKRSEVKKYIIDDKYVNVVLAIYSTDKTSRINDISIIINKFIEYTSANKINKNIESYVQAYMYGYSYFDFLEEKGSNTSIELSKEFMEMNSNKYSKDIYKFSTIALSNVTKDCTFNDSGMPIKKPYSISGWFPHYGKNGTGSKHAGIDFAVPLETPMYAIQDAEVVLIGNSCPVVGSLGNSCGANGMTGAGNYVLLKYIDKNTVYQVIYCHLTKPNVSVGDRVLKGQLIGFSGSSGNSSGSHAHIEIHKNPLSLTDVGVNSRTTINPCDYIKGLCE